MKNNEQWFLDRIGKTIYRDSVNCTCDACASGTDSGVIIQDEAKARYLYDTSCDMGIEYRDIK